MARGGTIVEIAKGYIDGQLDEIAQNIYTDMHSAIAKHKKYSKGAALGALMIEREPNSRFIGAYVGSDPSDGGLHIKWLNDGNNSHGARLRSTRQYDRKGRRPGKLNTPWGYKTSVSAHGGEHFIEAIASKYR